jgi:hypothetical protein
MAGYVPTMAEPIWPQATTILINAYLPLGAALRGGHPGFGRILFPFSALLGGSNTTPLSEEEREALAPFVLQSDGDSEALTIGAPTPEAVVDALRMYLGVRAAEVRQAAEAEAERLAEAERRRSAAIEAAEAWLKNPVDEPSFHVALLPVDLTRRVREAAEARHRADFDRWLQEELTAEERALPELQSAIDRGERISIRTHVQGHRHVREVVRWAAEHGSERLKAQVAGLAGLGLIHVPRPLRELYVEERLAVDCPGWSRDLHEVVKAAFPKADVSGPYSDSAAFASSPPPRHAVEALEAEPGATLRQVRCSITTFISPIPGLSLGPSQRTVFVLSRVHAPTGTEVYRRVPDPG